MGQDDKRAITTWKPASFWKSSMMKFGIAHETGEFVTTPFVDPTVKVKKCGLDLTFP
jgi:hypothetical protein